jgi:hypothetical protein
MDNTSNKINLDAGFLDFTVPLKFWSKVIWILGIIIFCVGLLVQIFTFNNMLFTNKLDFTFENLIPPLICLILGGALIVGSAPIPNLVITKLDPNTPRK